MDQEISNTSPTLKHNKIRIRRIVGGVLKLLYQYSKLLHVKRKEENEISKNVKDSSKSTPKITARLPYSALWLYPHLMIHFFNFYLGSGATITRR